MGDCGDWDNRRDDRFGFGAAEGLGLVAEFAMTGHDVCALPMSRNINWR
jgi:hypothetical protein